ncbi:hypothetical protein [Paraburkholderia sp. CNPSo 3281]|uniref:hypothetical protein n=1 Tax=Paraburkholderia sp. CNPSo 3281 TaxID=2940933 RepID=UPI0020B8C04D|nr:hypothetical protein [Paraburkholderia sp. CNPSo 3281]MCP3719403.1 hypothetical protein [Paraburkholderia sp. CNPSo 3281]
MNIAKQIVGYLKSRSLVLVSVETGTAGAIGAMLADQRTALLSVPRFVDGVLTRDLTQHGMTLRECAARERSERCVFPHCLFSIYIYK